MVVDVTSLSKTLHKARRSRIRLLPIPTASEGLPLWNSLSLSLDAVSIIIRDVVREELGRRGRLTPLQLAVCYSPGSSRSHSTSSRGSYLAVVSSFGRAAPPTPMEVLTTTIAPVTELGTTTKPIHPAPASCFIAYLILLRFSGTYF